MRYRFFPINVFLETDTLWRNLIKPGKDQGDRETDGEQPENDWPDPIRQVGEVNQHLGQLHDQPGSDRIKHRHAKDIAVLKLFDE